MAYSISICDTHRLPYFNATLVAYKIGTTTPIKFKHGKDGTPQYSDLKTNARGYICDTDGTILSRGVFVTEDALIKITLGDGTTTEWEVCADSDVTVNDGKLLGKKNKDSADDDLEEKWSANSGENYTLDYDHLIHKPDINEWAEVEQVVTMDTPVDKIDVDKYAKSMTVQFDQICCPSSWEWDGSNWKLKTGMTDKPNAEWSLQLIANPDRVAQVICIRNWTPWRLAIKNTVNEVIAVIDPFSGNSDKGEFVTLYGKTEPILPYKGAPDKQMLGTTHNIRFTKTSAQNTALTPLVLNDYTPDMAVIEFDDEYQYTPGALYVKSEVTKERKIRLLLNNKKTTRGLAVYDMTSGSQILAAVIANQAIVEFCVETYGLVVFNPPLGIIGPVANLHLGLDSHDLPVETTVANISIDDISGTLTLDSYTSKTITLNFTNPHGKIVQQYLSCGGVTTTLSVPSGNSSFVIIKSGTSVSVVKAPSSNGEVVPTSAYTEDGDRNNVYVYTEFLDGSVLKVNFASFNEKFSTHFGDNSGKRSDAFLAIPAFTGSTLSFVLHFESCMTFNVNTSRHIYLNLPSGNVELQKVGDLGFYSGSTNVPYAYYPERRVAVTVRKVANTYSVETEEVLL